MTKVPRNYRNLKLSSDIVLSQKQAGKAGAGGTLLVEQASRVSSSGDVKRDIQESGCEPSSDAVDAVQRGDITATDGPNVRPDWSWLSALRPRGRRRRWPVALIDPRTPLTRPR